MVSIMRGADAAKMHESGFCTTKNGLDLGEVVPFACRERRYPKRENYSNE